MLCAFHPALDPRAHDPFMGPQLTWESQPVVDSGGSVSQDESLAPALPADVQTMANGMPILNGRPSAPVDIYLDFDGDGSRTPYDEDGSPTSFAGSEQDNIYECWRQVCEYFAIFDINVTTVFTSSRPKAWIVMSNNHSGAGFSFVNVFPNSSAQSFNPSGDARSRVSGLAHELGHNFGLAHQSTYNLLGERTAEYASAPDPLHGPIMGVDYSGKVHKWILGHPSGSPSTLQDDIQVIANDIRTRQSPPGDGFRADDYGNTIASAFTLSLDPAATTHKTTGIIERLTDADAFAFTSFGGNVAIDATPVFPSGADLKLDVYDSGGTLLATADATDTNFQTLNLDLAAGSYYALVSSHGNYGDVGGYTFGVRDLPDGWLSEDVGVVGWGGFTEYDPSTGVFTHAGSGDNVNGSNDEMRFTYQTLTGDGTIVARVTELANTNSSAKLGVDIRESLNTNSKHAAMLMSRGNGPQFLYRSSTGGSATEVNNNTGQAFSPRWVKLERIGSTFRGYVSNDGVSWTQYGSAATVSMTQKVYVGLLSNAWSNTKLNVGKVDNVTVTGTLGGTPPVYNELPSPANVTVAPGGGTGLTITWDAVEGASGYRVEQSSDGVTFPTVFTTPAGRSDFVTSPLAGSLRYFYRISALDSTGGVSAPSILASGINRPSAVTGLSVTSWQTNAVILNWTDASGETGYKIERSGDGGANFSSIATVGRNIPSYTDSTVSAGQTYTYRVTPLSTLGDGSAVTAVGSARLAAVSGLQFVEVLANRVTLRWNDLPNETGYRVERSSNRTAWTALPALPAGVVQYTDSTVQPLSKYYYRVMGTSGAATGMFPTMLVGATPAATPLPAPWLSQDVGAVAGRGAAGSTNGTSFTVISLGSDIGGTADQFRYTYQPITGDGQIIARVASLDDTDGSARAGVMIRETLAGNSKHASMFVTPDNGVALRYRTTTGGSTSSTAGSTTQRAPVWLKVTRTGSTLRGYTSTDGAGWTEVGSISIPMTGNVYVGIAATSHDSDELNSSSFTNVQASPPAVLSAVLERPNRIRLVFGSDVGASLGADDLLIETSAGILVAPATAVTWTAATKTATFTFDAPLPNGNYRARLVRTGVRDAANFSLAADYLYSFHWLAGDVNDDRTVDFDDLSVMSQNYNSSGGRGWADGDFTGDGFVNFDDLSILAQNYNSTLPAAGAGVEEVVGASSPDAVQGLFSVTPVKPAAPKPLRRAAARRGV